MGYLLLKTPPYLADGELNVAALLLLFVVLFGFTTSIGILIALQMHKRWPALTGQPFYKPDPIIAIRQGGLFGLALVTIALLAFLQLADLAFVVVVLLLIVLFETFLQSRFHD
ncbi:MAG: hypothetical protein R3A44_01285 [Caldilineaceae bacterium]